MTETPSDAPVHALIAQRFSPYAFAPREIPASELRSLFEAARRAPSSFNEQPWRFLVARRGDDAAFKAALEGLVDANRSWARNASAIVFTVASERFARNDKPNRHAAHDVGLAVSQLTLEATARGLHVHQMAGILPDHVREIAGVPAGFEVLTGLAIGYLAQGDEASAELRERDAERRPRRALDESVFGLEWGRPAL